MSIWSVDRIQEINDVWIHRMYEVASKVVLEYKERSMITIDMPKMVTKEESNLVSNALMLVIPTIAALSSLVERLLRGTLRTRNVLEIYES